jgi:hypothetical protein
VQWNAHKVEVANAKLMAMEREWKAANEANARDVAAALQARKNAEDMARKVESEAGRAAARAADARRVRKPAPSAAPVATGWSLPGVPVLPGKPPF